MATRNGSAEWKGNLPDGSGTVTVGDDVYTGNYSFKSRFEDEKGTNPEELLAAAHAACFAMALSFELQGRKATPRSLEVSARVGFDPKVGGGYEVSFSELTVRGDVADISDEEFQEAVQQASQGCPISSALKGNVAITAEATRA